MKISDIIARLKAESALLQNRVFGAVELANAQPNSLQSPCAFVIPRAEKAEPNSLIGAISQRITAQIGVVICIRNYRDVRGEGGHVELENVRAEIADILIGWQPPNTDIPMEFLQGQIAAYDNAVIRWNDVFTTQFYYRKYRNA